MRIAILPDAYLPNGTYNHAKMLHELAVQFISLGHEVVVITPGEQKQSKILTVDDIDGVEVWRFKCRPTRGVSHLNRVINETLLSYYAYRAISSEGINCRFDICVNYSPTIFFGPLAKWLKRKGAFIYLVLRDFFPQWIIDEGLISDGDLPARYLRFFEKLNYDVSDIIALQSPANIDVFKGMTRNDKYNIDVLYNWASPIEAPDDSFGEKYISELGLNEKFIFFYGGNIGHAQDMPSILKLSQSLSCYNNIHFLILGQGDQFKYIAEYIEKNDLKNVTLSPSISQKEYQSLLTKVHIGLFTLAASHKAHNFPGKILGYLNEGLPILGCVNSGNDLIEIVNESGAGTVVVNGQDEALVQAAEKIYLSNELYIQMSQASKRLLTDKFSVSNAANQILDSFMQGKK